MKFFPILIFLLLLASCGAPSEGNAQDSAQASGSEGGSGTAVRAELEGEPALGDAKVLVYVLKDNEGVSGATVEVTGDMTHAGMSPVVAEAKEVGAGLYETEGFEFTMAGDWILTADVAYPDGEEVEDTLALSVPGQ